jgi:hypothetical protein
MSRRKPTEAPRNLANQAEVQAVVRVINVIQDVALRLSRWLLLRWREAEATGSQGR